MHFKLFETMNNCFVSFKVRIAPPQSTPERGSNPTLDGLESIHFGCEGADGEPAIARPFPSPGAESTLGA
jgi:hypothetical protein